MAEGHPGDVARQRPEARTSERASIRWWVGGLILGVMGVAALALAATAAVVLFDATRGSSANREVEAQLPAVASAVAQVVASQDADARMASAGSCNGDSPARVSTSISVEPGSAEEVAAELVRAAEDAGWKPSSDPGAPDHQLERTFGGKRFNFKASPATDSVFVQSYYLGVEDCS